MTANSAGGDSMPLHAVVRKFTSQLSASQYMEQDFKPITASALALMRQLPVARNAVLSYFGRRFDDAANRYLQYRVDKINGNMYNISRYSEEAAYESLSAISTGFHDLIAEQCWAPQFSKWAIDLLGHISKKLNSSNAAPLASTTSTVEDKLELWMGCSATKILIEIASSCFSVVVDKPSAVDACVDSLLEASILYTPHFDWVVAHLGSCFPKTIIDRVLIAGYKDFISPSPQGSSKFSSAAAILNYLSGQHKTTARDCIISYFQNALNQPPPGAATAVTFLLNTFSLSSTMMPVITSDIGAIVNVQTLNKLAAHYIAGVHDFQSWQNRNFALINLMQIVVHLLLKLEQSSLLVINAILDLACGNINTDDCGHEPLLGEVRTAAQHILGKLSTELLKATTCNRVNTKIRTELSTLKFLILGHKSLTRRLHLTKANESEAKVVCRLLLACGWQGGVTTAVDILHEFLSLDRTWTLSTFSDLLEQWSVRYTDLEENLCIKIFTCVNIEPTVLANLQAYINTKNERSEKVARCIAKSHMKGLASIIESGDLTDHLDCLSLYAELVNSYSGKYLGHMPPSDVLVPWYFECVQMECYEEANRLQKSIVQSCAQSVSTLCSTLRKILTTAMTKTKISNTNSDGDDGTKISLSKINSALLRRLHLPPTKTYILHNDHIGRGKREGSGKPRQENEFAYRQHLVLLIIRCCEVETSAFNLTDAKVWLSQLVLELVAPDVIAAKTLWHDPITHERELAIRRTTDDFPFLWNILEYICTYKPSFVTISLLVRCHIATISTSWGKAIDGPARGLPKEMSATERVMSFLIKTDLLPKPLIYIPELFPYIACYEIKLLLDIVYRYLMNSLRMGLTQDPLDHDDMKTVQSIIQQNISTVSEISHKFLLVE